VLLLFKPVAVWESWCRGDGNGCWLPRRALVGKVLICFAFGDFFPCNSLGETRFEELRDFPGPAIPSVCAKIYVVGGRGLDRLILTLPKENRRVEEAYRYLSIARPLRGGVGKG
jgi:hypothetical protein